MLVKSEIVSTFDRDYLINTSQFRTHTFGICKKMADVPKHYIIWNIGNNMTEGYIPLAERLSYDKNDDNYHMINEDTLLTVKVSIDDWKIIDDKSIKSEKAAKLCMKYLREFY